MVVHADKDLCHILAYFAVRCITHPVALVLWAAMTESVSKLLSTGMALVGAVCDFCEAWVCHSKKCLQT